MVETPIATSRWQRLLEGLHRYRYALAPLSFAAGLASFLLIERREWLAQWVSALLILGWVLILAEEWAARRLRLSPGVLRFGIQAIQQETFFFTLPFFLHTTTWTTEAGVVRVLVRRDVQTEARPHQHALELETRSFTLRFDWTEGDAFTHYTIEGADEAVRDRVVDAVVKATT